MAIKPYSASSTVKHSLLFEGFLMEFENTKWSYKNNYWLNKLGYNELLIIFE